MNLKEEITAFQFSEVIEQIKKQNGIVLLVHPYYSHKLSEINFSSIDLIEGYNGRVSREKNELAVKLAIENNIPVVAGSDSHIYGEIGNCRTYYNDLSDLIHPVKTEFTRNKFYSDVISQGIKVVKTRKVKELYKWIKYYQN